MSRRVAPKTRTSSRRRDRGPKAALAANLRQAIEIDGENESREPQDIDRTAHTKASGSVASLLRPVVLLHHTDKAVRESITKALAGEKVEIVAAPDGRTALQILESGKVDVAILSTLTAEISGLDLLKHLRANPLVQNIPVLVLAEGADYERIVSLELGADDCVPAPFAVREIGLRVRSLLRRSYSISKPLVIHHRDFHFDLAAHEVRVFGELVHLTRAEFRLLSLLVKKMGFVVERRDLAGTLSRSSGLALDYKTINTHMRRLRKKLGVIGDEVRSVRGVGYRFTWKP